MVLPKVNFGIFLALKPKKMFPKILILFIKVKKNLELTRALDAISLQFPAFLDACNLTSGQKYSNGSMLYINIRLQLSFAPSNMPQKTEIGAGSGGVLLVLFANAIFANAICGH